MTFVFGVIDPLAVLGIGLAYFAVAFPLAIHIGRKFDKAGKQRKADLRDRQRHGMCPELRVIGGQRGPGEQRGQPA